MKIIKGIALVLAAVLMCTSVSCAFATGKSYEDLIREFEELQSKTMDIHLIWNGLYEVKSYKFYGRKIIGIGGDGTFALGQWELLSSDEHFGMTDCQLTLPQTYMAFAYSVDITWGTDFPFSGVFWSSTEEPVEKILIQTGGGVRSVGLWIEVNNRVVYYEPDCDSHSEWTP